MLEMGTVVYVGLVLSLQMKVAFLHHVWNKIHVISMAISIIGLFLALLVINSSTSEYDYYGVVVFDYTQGIFWFFGCFSIPLILSLIDFTVASFTIEIKPSPETIFREIVYMNSNSEFDNGDDFFSVSPAKGHSLASGATKTTSAIEL